VTNVRQISGVYDKNYIEIKAAKNQPGTQPGGISKSDQSMQTTNFVDLHREKDKTQSRGSKKQHRSKVSKTDQIKLVSIDVQTDEEMWKRNK